MVWVFLRHGESTANAGGTLAGWEDVPLTPLGEQQARAAGAQILGLELARVVTSDLERALRTAELVLGVWSAGRATRPPIIATPSLRERHLGAWSGLSLAELRADGRNETLFGWDTRPPEGESHLDLARRSLRALASLDEDLPTLFVSHGGLLRTLFGLLDGTPRDQIGRNRIPNAVPVSREIAPGTWARLRAELGEAPSVKDHGPCA